MMRNLTIACKLTVYIKIKTRVNTFKSKNATKAIFFVFISFTIYSHRNIIGYIRRIKRNRICKICILRKISTFFSKALQLPVSRQLNFRSGRYITKIIFQINYAFIIGKIPLTVQKFKTFRLFSTLKRILCFSKWNKITVIF